MWRKSPSFQWAWIVVAVIVPTLRGAESGRLTLEKELFGATSRGTPVERYTLSNGHGMRVRIMTYGGIVVSLEVPDRDGRLGNVVLGFERLDPYLAGHPYFGAICGRVANRIAHGTFTLDGTTYRLAANNGPHHLHGGLVGFDKVVWEGAPLREADRVGVVLRCLSKDGEEGYPGNLRARVQYTLNEKSELGVEYEATTDAPTPVNLTHHSYFNLAGAGSGDVLGHQLMIDADRYTPVDDTLIPTGSIAEVKGTPLDFTRPTAIGARIAQVAGGYDHNFVLRPREQLLARPAATVYEPTTGRVLEIFTTEPGLQFYSGNFLDGIAGAGGVYHKHHGFCLEAQHFPNSPNEPDFPSVILRPGQTYRQTTIHRFGVRR